MTTTDKSPENATIVNQEPRAARESFLDPEFLDWRGLERVFSIKRSLAYCLLNDGLIDGVSLRRRNQVRGKRLFKVDSVRAYLNSQMSSGE